MSYQIFTAAEAVTAVFLFESLLKEEQAKRISASFQCHSKSNMDRMLINFASLLMNAYEEKLYRSKESTAGFIMACKIDPKEFLAMERK